MTRGDDGRVGEDEIVGRERGGVGLNSSRASGGIQEEQGRDEREERRGSRDGWMDEIREG